MGIGMGMGMGLENNEDKVGGLGVKDWMMARRAANISK